MTTSQMVLRRTVAGLIDYGVFFLFLAVYMKIFGEELPDGRLAVNGFRHVFAILAVWLMLFPWAESWFGFTMGKGLFDLKVVSITGGREISFWQGLRRHLLDPVDVFLGLVVIVVVWRSGTPRRLGDLWGHTLVVGPLSGDQHGATPNPSASEK